MSLFLGNIISASVKLSEYLDFIDSNRAKLDRILQGSFNSAKLNLEYALRTSNEKERMDYVRRAKEKFIDALATEKSADNLFMSYFSLAFCNKLLNDEQNMRKNLQSAYKVYEEVKHAANEEVWTVVDEAVAQGSGGDDDMMKFGKGILAVASLGIFPIIDKTQAAYQRHEINKAKEQLAMMEPFVKEILSSNIIENV